MCALFLIYQKKPDLKPLPAVDRLVLKTTLNRSILLINAQPSIAFTYSIAQ